MGLMALALTCGVVSALLFPLSLYFNLVFSSIFFGYFSYFSAGALNSTWKYALAANFYGAILAFILVKLHPILGGGNWAMMILVFFLAVFYVLAANIDLLSKAFCTFSGGVCFFSTVTIMSTNATAWPGATPETALVMALVCMFIGHVSGFISCNVPELIKSKKE